MKKILNNFIQELKSNQKLKDEFTKCKSLKESFNRFMKGKCSYEEYESFFKDLIQKQTQLSDQDLEQVAGGKGLGKILLPVTLVAMLAGASAMSASAAPPKGGVSAVSTSIKPNDTNSNLEDNDSGLIEKTIDGFNCTFIKYQEIMIISSKSENKSKLDLSILDEYIKQYPDATTIKIGEGIKELYIGPNDTMDLIFRGAKDLESIKVDKQNKRYFADECALWEIASQGNLNKMLKIFGEAGKQKYPEKTINLDGIECSINPHDSNGPLVSLKGSNEAKVLNTQSICERLGYIPKTFNIGEKINHLNIGPNDTMDLKLSNASDLESINVDPKNERYSADEFALYSMEKGELAVKYSFEKGRICDGKIKFKNPSGHIFVEGTDEKRPVALDLSIFDKYIKARPYITINIGSGIKSIKLGNQNVDISKASDLKGVDLGTDNKKYKIDDLHLCKINDQGRVIKDLGAINEQSIYDFCFNMINTLPKLEGEEKFEEIAKGKIEKFKPYMVLPDLNNLENVIKYEPNKEKTGKGNSLITKTINGKEIYKKIEDVVKDLKNKVKNRTPQQDESEENIRLKIKNKEYSEHYQMDENWRVAKAIYRWVAKNISYDNDSAAYGHKRKSQDPLSVFENKMGVCEGYSLLINLMMRMAGIPSLEITTIYEKDGDNEVHAYNAIYLPNSPKNIGKDEKTQIINKESGWVLFDATWGSPNQNTTDEKITTFKNKTEPEYEKKKEKLKNKFPSFYSQNEKSKIDSEEIFKWTDHRIGYFMTKNEPSNYFDNSNGFSNKDWTLGLTGSLQNPSIWVGAKKSDDQKKQPRIDFKISEISKEFLDHKFPITIGKGIKTLHIGENDDVELKFSKDSDLESIDVDEKNKLYFADEIALWEKNDKNEPEKLVRILKRPNYCGEGIDRVQCIINDNCIYLQGENINFDKLPTSLKLMSKNLKKPFHILKCTNSLHLGQDDDFELKLSYLFNPTSIEIHEDNQKYEMRNNALYNKDSHKMIYEIKPNQK